MPSLRNPHLSGPVHSVSLILRSTIEIGAFPNEASVSQFIVLRLLHALGLACNYPQNLGRLHKI